MLRMAQVCCFCFAVLSVPSIVAWAFKPDAADPGKAPVDATQEPAWVKDPNAPAAFPGQAVRIAVLVVSAKGDTPEDAAARAHAEGCQKLHALLQPDIAGLLPDDENPPTPEHIRATRERILAACLKSLDDLDQWTAPTGEVFLLTAFRRAQLFQFIEVEEAEAEKAGLRDFAERMADRRVVMEETYQRALENLKRGFDPEMAADLAEAPDWVRDPLAAFPTERARIIAGLGWAPPGEIKKALQHARMRAASDIARQIDTQVKILFSVERDDQGNEQITEIVTRTSQASLSGIRDDRIWKSPQGRIFVLAVMPVENVQRALEADLEQAIKNEDAPLQDRLRRALARLKRRTR